MRPPTVIFAMRELALIHEINARPYHTHITQLVLDSMFRLDQHRLDERAQLYNDKLRAGWRREAYESRTNTPELCYVDGSWFMSLVGAASVGAKRVHLRVHLPTGMAHITSRGRSSCCDQRPRGQNQLSPYAFRIPPFPL